MNKATGNQAISKYLDRDGKFNPFLSEKVKEAYQGDRQRRAEAQKDTSKNIWEKIFKKPF